MNAEPTSVALRHLTAALEEQNALHEPGRRERYRASLSRALDAAAEALAGPADATALVLARSILVQAHAAKAEDARHGAGQLSLSAQRAPTVDACDDGWRRVEAIVVGAEASARVALAEAQRLELDASGTRAARDARAGARRAEASAAAARKLVNERNVAYTFHTDNGFSFGEGWYLAAAALLAGVAVQIEPGHAEGAAQAEAFLREAGLARNLQPYRSRPRAMKQTTALVARAFRAEPAAAQARLRAAFLGDAPISNHVRAWVDARLGPASAAADSKKVLIWIRDGAHQPGRNSTYAEICELVGCARETGLVPILTGDALKDGVPEGALDLILFWKAPIFRGVDRRRAQLGFFEHLRRRHGLVGQLGVTTAGMDGPALMGLPTLYLTEAPNVRMGEWVGAVPGYEEVVRGSGYLERITRVLGEWARR